MTSQSENTIDHMATCNHEELIYPDVTDGGEQTDEQKCGQCGDVVAKAEGRDYSTL